ncbi:MAG: nucleotidyl transferase AbiEii/AbiGii toxin family protein [Bradyrhizobium sp.]|nr:nucleotidyl transferase AbiEii/AbiGii toxin family protein [Bradyrhizobium sp.]
MADAFLSLSAEDRLDALTQAAADTGRPLHLLEKDIWVVWALQLLGTSHFDDHIVFKGGTSLSKAFGVIDRFSEDVDLTYDIREIAGDLLAKGKDERPVSNSQQKSWTKEIRVRLQAWVEEEMQPLFERAIAEAGLPAKAIAAPGEKLFIEYEPLAKGSGYVKPAVMLEFGARSTGEPAGRQRIVSDAAASLDTLIFPEATPRVMIPERTFWEKATAIHVFCRQGKLRGERFARHWYDLVRLDDAGIADRAIADAALTLDVAAHKQDFFAEKDESGVIDYTAAVSGGLQLVPEGEALASLREDYAKMVEDGLLLNAADPFDALMERCRSIGDRANRRVELAF